MLALILGGAASGKSAHAETLCCQLATANKLYLATMDTCGAHAQARIQKHREMRAGKGFVTVEQMHHLETLSIATCYGGILLEDIGNLVANTLFAGENSQKMTDEAILDCVLNGIVHVQKSCKHLVMVSNLIFSDGLRYDEMSRRYISLMGCVNQSLAQRSDYVAESVCGILIDSKGTRP